MRQSRQPVPLPHPKTGPVAVVGAGWAGLAAAVALVKAGREVTVYEMAPAAGGRARQVQAAGGEFDNGQHILIGAYRHTLALMRQVGADPEALLMRRPLAFRYPDGSGLALPGGRPTLAFVRAVLAASGWRLRDRLALLRWAGQRLRQRFECAADLTVGQLCQALPTAVQQDLIDPLCVAALNTPAASASAQVFLRVLQDALFAGPGSADVLLPRVPLSALLPEPASRWLQQAGAQWRLQQRVQTLQAMPPTSANTAGWRVDGHPFAAVVLACSAVEAARLSAPHQPAWAQQARSLQHSPIITAYLADPALRLPQPMLALRAGADAPAQFVFDLGALGRNPGCFAWVVSGAGDCLAAGLADSGQRILRQARATFPGHFGAEPGQVIQHLAAERRATFACVPGLDRPAMQIAPGLLAAGDYIAGPYPATLEGAVRSGQAAALALG